MAARYNAKYNKITATNLTTVATDNARKPTNCTKMKQGEADELPHQSQGMGATTKKCRRALARTQRHAPDAHLGAHRGLTSGGGVGIVHNTETIDGSSSAG
jgi:hypothetical protein